MPEHEPGIDPRFQQTVGAPGDLCVFLPVSIHGLVRERCSPFYRRGPGHDSGRIDMGGNSLSAHIDTSADAFRTGRRHKGQKASADGGHRDLCRGLYSGRPRHHGHGTDSCPRPPGKRRCNAGEHWQEASLSPEKRTLEVRSHPNPFVALRGRCMPGDRSAIFCRDNTSERSATHVWQRTTQEKATERSI